MKSCYLKKKRKNHEEVIAGLNHHQDRNPEAEVEVEIMKEVINIGDIKIVVLNHLRDHDHQEIILTKRKNNSRLMEEIKNLRKCQKEIGVFSAKIMTSL
jgi:hypothetical protein